jgi:hypothetical protein
MSISLDRAIHDHLAAYLAGENTLDEFKDWLVGATWELTPDDNSVTAKLAIRIKHRLAEHSGGFISDDELKQSLQPCIYQPVAR